jgi:hypothetical protein
LGWNRASKARGFFVWPQHRALFGSEAVLGWAAFGRDEEPGPEAVAEAGRYYAAHRRFFLASNSPQKAENSLLTTPRFCAIITVIDNGIANGNDNIPH